MTVEVTQDALDRVEKTLRRELLAFQQLAAERQGVIERRLRELNNAHDRAIVEKQRTDEAATRIQERAVTKADLQLWRDEVERRLNVMAGAATVRATLLSVGIGVIVVLLNLAIRYLSS